MTLLAQDHLVLVVSDIESGITKWRDLLGLTLQHRVNHESHGIRQAFFPLSDGTFVELIAPTDDDSPIARIIEERGEGLHVLALKVDDLETAVRDLEANGARLIGKDTDRVFIHPDSTGGVMIQLWPKDRPHRWRGD